MALCANLVGADMLLKDSKKKKLNNFTLINMQYMHLTFIVMPAGKQWTREFDMWLLTKISVSLLVLIGVDFYSAIDTI